MYHTTLTNGEITYDCTLYSVVLYMIRANHSI